MIKLKSLIFEVLGNDSEFDSIFNKYFKKNWFSNDEEITSKKAANKASGSKYSDEQIEEFVYDRTRNATKASFDNLKTLIQKHDVNELVERLRSSQTMSREFYKALTGTDIRGMNQSQLRVELEK